MMLGIGQIHPRFIEGGYEGATVACHFRTMDSVCLLCSQFDYPRRRSLPFSLFSLVFIYLQIFRPLGAE